MKKIDFKTFKEEEIQELIGKVYEQKAKVNYLHLSDRANEDGADLQILEENNPIAIAVKIKPSNQDRMQLKDLSDRKENKKIYVYIITPTKKFLEDMKNYTNVEFWDNNILNDFILKNSPGLFAWLLFQESETYKIMIEMTNNFYKLKDSNEKSEKENVNEMDGKSVEQLWRLKDSSVTINKLPDYCEELFNEPPLENNEAYQSYYLNWFMEFIYSLKIELWNFDSTFKEFYTKNKELVNNSIIQRACRSHWLYLKSLNSEDFDRIPNREYDSIWSVISIALNEINEFGRFLESFTDDILSEYLRDYTLKYNATNPFKE